MGNRLGFDGYVDMTDRSKPEITILWSEPVIASPQDDMVELLGVLVHEYAHKLQRATSSVVYDPVDPLMDHEEVFAHAVEIANWLHENDMTIQQWRNCAISSPYLKATSRVRNKLVKHISKAIDSF